MRTILCVLVAGALSLPCLKARDAFAQASPTSAEIGSEADLNAIADVLLPETRDWTPFTSYPKATADDLVFARSIADSYKSGQWGDAGYCSPFLRIDADDPAKRPEFRTGKILGDDRVSFLHSGLAYCTKGRSGSIWKDISKTDVMRNDIGVGTILRVQAGKGKAAPARALGYTERLGEDGSNDFRITTVGAFGYKTVTTPAGLAIPAGMVSVERDLDLTSATDLRAKPERNARALTTKRTGYVRPKAGERVRQLGSWIDGSGAEWRLVLQAIPGATDGSQDYAAGWIKP